MRDAYEHFIQKMGSLSVIPITCLFHQDILPFLIMEYVRIRFYFESKHFRDLHLSKIKTSVQTGNKLRQLIRQ